MKYDERWNYFGNHHGLKIHLYKLYHIMFAILIVGPIILPVGLGYAHIKLNSIFHC